MMKFKFEKLIIWQKAMDYGESIFRLSYKFPKEEMYNLSSQIRRAEVMTKRHIHLRTSDFGLRTD